MRVVADSHILLFYLFTPGRLVQLGLPLVTVDRAMSRCGGMQVIQ